MPIGISSSIWYTLLITAVQPSSHLQLSYRYLSDVYPELNSYLTLSRLSTERLNIIQTVSSTGSVYYLSATYQAYVTLILGYISSSNLACSLDSNIQDSQAHRSIVFNQYTTNPYLLAMQSSIMMCRINVSVSLSSVLYSLIGIEVSVLNHPINICILLGFIH